MSNISETCWKWSFWKGIIFTKVHKDWTKDMDFSWMANFWICLVFYPDFIFEIKIFFLYTVDGNLWKNKNLIFVSPNLHLGLLWFLWNVQIFSSIYSKPNFWISFSYPCIGPEFEFSCLTDNFVVLKNENMFKRILKQVWKGFWSSRLHINREHLQSFAEVCNLWKF